METASTPTIVVGVTGCIAAYKSCELVRTLQKAGCRVKVVMTENATRFVGPATFRALTGEPVAVSLWDEPFAGVHHVSLAEEADVFVVAPATANVLAKLAVGRADDLLTTSVLATAAPLVIAPAMNVHMWRAEATVANVTALRARGAVIVEPEVGELACGEVGEGRLADVAVIAEAALGEARRSRDLLGVRVLVTAGPTREYIDPVRFVTNGSSGITGYAIAEEAARRGADVTLVSGPTTLPDPFGVRTVRVSTAAEMAQACEDAYGAADVLVATAAVSDFRPVESSAHKVKKEHAPDSVRFERTTDILSTLAARKEHRVVVGFAAETQDVLGNARVKLAGKSLDLVVANDVSDPSVGFASQVNRVWFVDADGESELPLQSKRSIACALWDRLAKSAHDAASKSREEQS
jgi:phosphopantothenoylcysteine decarboxylase/phosphopantothenate--cysteine ligase